MLVTLSLSTRGAPGCGCMLLDRGAAQFLVYRRSVVVATLYVLVVLTAGVGMFLQTPYFTVMLGWMCWMSGCNAGAPHVALVMAVPGQSLW